MELNKENLEQVQKDIGHKFKDIELLRQALTHSSYANEKGRNSYERLEFLGDSVLSLYISNRLYDMFPNATEGDLTKAKADLVNGRMQTTILNNTGSLSQFINHSIGNQTEKGLEKVKGQVLEAIIGAVFKDGEWKATNKVMEKFYGKYFKKMKKDYKKNKPINILVPNSYSSQTAIAQPSPVIEVKKEQEKNSSDASKKITRREMKRENMRKLNDLVTGEKGLTLRCKTGKKFVKQPGNVKLELIKYEGPKGKKVGTTIFEIEESKKETAASRALEFMLIRNNIPFIRYDTDPQQYHYKRPEILPSPINIEHENSRS